jgi:hypothetical protein
MVMESFIERYGLMKYNGRHPLKMGTCELCPPTAPPPPSQTVYDHCHQHGWIRGEGLYLAQFPPDRAWFLPMGAGYDRVLESLS